MALILLSIAPVIIIAVYIYIRDKYEREPLLMLLKGLFLGGIGTGIVRALTAVPAHALFGVIMGYFISKAKFSMPKKRIYLFYALLSPVLLHGSYDTIVFLIIQPGIGMAIFLLIILFILFLIFLYILGFRKINESVESSQFKDKAPN